jgi:hypothetical protein
MKWALYIAAAIVGVIILVALIGLALPKAHRATRMARFRQSPQTVFALITGPQDWRPGITKWEQLPPDSGPRKWRQESQGRSITFEETACDPPRLYRLQIADRNLPFSGTWTWEITPTEDGCTCRITEEGEVFNPIFRFMSRFIFGQTRTIVDYLNAMGKKFNEPVKIEA